MSLTAAAGRAGARVLSLPLRRVAIALVAAGLLLRLAFALLPLQVHLILLEDDAWMITAIARHFALGHGVTADGVHVTNGFQPLYPLTLGALPYLLAPDALDAGFTANLVICAILATLAAWPLWCLARRFGGDVAGVIALAWYALNPAMIRVSINAMETSLGLLLLLTLFVAFYELDLTRVRNLLLLALLTALATLARLDASLAFAAIGLTLVLRALPGPRSLSALARRLAPVALYAAATLLLLLPYFLFNLSVSGSFGPSSGAALAFMHSYAGDFHLTNGLRGLFLNSAVHVGWVPAPWMLFLLVLVVAGLFVALLGRALIAALPLLLYIPVPLLYYGYILQQARERYFVGLSAVLIVLLAWLGAYVLRRFPSRASTSLVALALVVVIALNTVEAFGFYERMRTHPELTQPTAYQAALWIRDNLPPDALVGAKNSGIYQYYSGRTVLNIDGKLNHAIVPVMRQRALLDYLRAQHVEYLVDREETMARHVAFYSHQFGPGPAHRTPTLIERMVIYGKIAANRVGANLPLQLDSRDAWQPQRPFTDVAVVEQRFPRPNQAANPVVIYRLLPADASGTP